MSDIYVNDLNYHILNSKAKIIINYGGRDSGKSFFVGGQYTPLAMETEPYLRGVAIRKTYASLKDSVFQEIMDGVEVMGLSHKFNGTKSPLEIHHSNGNRILFRGLDNPVKIKSLKGINFIWVEEAEDLTEREFWDLVILLRGSGYQRIILTFNPIDEEHFSNRMFVQPPADKVIEKFEDGDKKVWINKIKQVIDNKPVEIETLIVRSTFDDNAFIPPTRKAIIENLKESDPFLYDVYRRGKFGTRGGKILTNVELLDFEKEGIYFDNFDNKGYSQDFGFNHANCILSVAEKDKFLFVFDEVYEYEKDTSELIRIASDRGVRQSHMMICDSAEPDRIKQWRKAGFKAYPVHKYEGSVKAQIDWLKQFKKIYINTKCVNTWKESKSYTWKQDKHGKFLDEPVTIFDDAMAALRYSKDLFSKKGRLSAVRRVL